jgi:hypothetical protein
MIFIFKPVIKAPVRRGLFLSDELRLFARRPTAKPEIEKLQVADLFPPRVISLVSPLRHSATGPGFTGLPSIH